MPLTIKQSVGRAIAKRQRIEQAIAKRQRIERVIAIGYERLERFEEQLDMFYSNLKTCQSLTQNVRFGPIPDIFSEIITVARQHQIKYLKLVAEDSELLKFKLNVDEARRKRIVADKIYTSLESCMKILHWLDNDSVDASLSTVTKNLDIIEEVRLDMGVLEVSVELRHEVRVLYRRLFELERRLSNFGVSGTPAAPSRSMSAVGINGFNPQARSAVYDANEGLDGLVVAACVVLAAVEVDNTAAAVSNTPTAGAAVTVDVGLDGHIVDAVNEDLDGLVADACVVHAAVELDNSAAAVDNAPTASIAVNVDVGLDGHIVDAVNKDLDGLVVDTSVVYAAVVVINSTVAVDNTATASAAAAVGDGCVAAIQDSKVDAVVNQELTCLPLSLPLDTGQNACNVAGHNMAGATIAANEADIVCVAASVLAVDIDDGGGVPAKPNDLDDGVCAAASVVAVDFDGGGCVAVKPHAVSAGDTDIVCAAASVVAVDFDGGGCVAVKPHAIAANEADIVCVAASVLAVDIDDGGGVPAKPNDLDDGVCAAASVVAVDFDGGGCVAVKPHAVSAGDTDIVCAAASVVAVDFATAGVAVSVSDDDVHSAAVAADAKAAANYSVEDVTVADNIEVGSVDDRCQEGFQLLKMDGGSGAALTAVSRGEKIIKYLSCAIKLVPCKDGRRHLVFDTGWSC